MRALGAACVLGAAIGLPGCAIQATSGVAHAGHDDVKVPLSIGAMTHVPRISEGVVGARLGVVFDQGAVPKHVIVHGGYDARIAPGKVVVQPALELGAGSPVSRSWGSPGAYLGAAVALRLRVAGTGEEAAYNAVATGIDAVVMPRVGGWMAPESSGEGHLVGEYAVECGLRFTFGSDLFSPTRGRVEERPTVTEGGK